MRLLPGTSFFLKGIVKLSALGVISCGQDAWIPRGRRLFVLARDGKGMTLISGHAVVTYHKTTFGDLVHEIADVTPTRK
jgi:hypothetical protein